MCFSCCNHTLGLSQYVHFLLQSFLKIHSEKFLREHYLIICIIFFTPTSKFNFFISLKRTMYHKYQNGVTWRSPWQHGWFIIFLHDTVIIFLNDTVNLCIIFTLSLCQRYISSWISILYSYKQDKEWNAGKINKVAFFWPDFCLSMILNKKNNVEATAIFIQRPKEVIS